MIVFSDVLFVGGLGVWMNQHYEVEEAIKRNGRRKKSLTTTLASLLPAFVAKIFDKKF